MARVRRPTQAQTVDQLWMFEIADLLLVIIQLCSGLAGNDINAKVGVPEQAVGRSARETADDEASDVPS